MMAIVLACEVCGGPTVGAVGGACEGCEVKPSWRNTADTIIDWLPSAITNVIAEARKLAPSTWLEGPRAIEVRFGCDPIEVDVIVSRSIGIFTENGARQCDQRRVACTIRAPWDAQKVDLPKLVLSQLHDDGRWPEPDESEWYDPRKRALARAMGDWTVGS